jgi:hypothetical protein
VPGDLTEVKEIVTAMGMLGPTLEDALACRPPALVNVGEDAWRALLELHEAGGRTAAFAAAFANGQAFLSAVDGLRGRAPVRVEWKGPHRPPGDDTIPADLRIDHVFLVSCKYLSKVLVNAGPPRLFERLLVGDERSAVHWFGDTAPVEFQALYDAAREHSGLAALPAEVMALTRPQQRALKSALRDRLWPEPLGVPWSTMCAAVSAESARRWAAAMVLPRDQLRLLWRMLRITTATYFVLGTDRADHLRLRIDSAWDWMQAYELRAFEVAPRAAGQPEVAWRATVRRRADQAELTVDGHVEVRWSHGRFLGSPESKIYLDTPHALVPGYNPLE